MNVKIQDVDFKASNDLFSEKTADTFEQAADEACEALEIQLKKLKDRISGR